jgi:hypothetical protein
LTTFARHRDAGEHIGTAEEAARSRLFCAVLAPVGFEADALLRNWSRACASRIQRSNESGLLPAARHVVSELNRGSSEAVAAELAKMNKPTLIAQTMISLPSRATAASDPLASTGRAATAYRLDEYREASNFH